jgi:hypothetical protein
MKTFYLLKSFFPFVFLPIAPGVVQVELERHGLLSYGAGAYLSISIQIAFTLAVIVWLVHSRQRAQTKEQVKAFLKMSCVSKKVFHGGNWITVERYLAENHNITVSHGMTPEESTAWLRQSEEWLRNESEIDFHATADVESVSEKHALLAK